MEKKEKIFTKKEKNNGFKFLAGITGLALIGGSITACNACHKSNKNDKENDNTSVTTTMPVTKPTEVELEVTEAIKSEEIDYKTIYLTKEEFVKGAVELSNYLTSKGNETIKPVDVMSLYYIANMDNISNDVFEQLVTEGYLPENGIDIIISSFGPMDDLRDYMSLNMNDGKMVVFDYSKLFVNKYVADTFNESQKDLNDFTYASTLENQEELLVSIREKQNNFILGEYSYGKDTKEFGNLPVGAQFIYQNIQSKTYDIVGAEQNINVGGQARIDQEEDISNLAMSIEKEFSCLEDTQKIKVK